ncbi:MAG TPA: outer membrane beta-barrel protein [Gammaproteobacteria bacterium]
MNIKHTIAAVPLAVAGLALPLASFAAASDWMGPYIGAHASYLQDNNVKMDSGGSSSNSFDMTGALGGVQGGYNWASGGMVLGIQASASVGDVNGDTECAPGAGVQCGAKMDQLYTITGKVGVPLNNFLLYASLGGASAQIEAKLSSGGVEITDSNYTTGWLAGLGGAMAFNNHWNGFVEVNYLDFGSNDYISGSGISIENKFYALNLGVNYKF